MAMARDFTVGVEEEYLLVGRESRDLIREAPTAMVDMLITERVAGF